MNSPRSSISGFNMIELMLVVAIAGILLVVAIPGFTWLTESQRVKNASFEIYALLNVARSEAIKRNADVSIAPVDVSGVFDHIEVTAADGTLLYNKSAPKNVGIKASPGGAIIFRRTGRPSVSGIALQIDVAGTGDGGVADPPTEHVRCISLGLSGMPQTRKGACS